MRKSVIGLEPVAGQKAPEEQGAWLDLEQIAAVEVSSEDSLFPVEHALGQTQTTGWRAAATGPQLIRLNFDKPAAIRRIQLHFVDRAAERSQEFAIYARTDGGEMREVVRQQYSFSPGGSTEETEDYAVELNGVTSLELRIDPDRAHDPAHSQHFAVLQRLRLA